MATTLKQKNKFLTVYWYFPGYAIIQLPEMVLLLCKSLKAWNKKNSFASSDDSNRMERSLSHIHGLDTHVKKKYLGGQKIDDVDTKRNPDTHSRAHRK